MADTGIFATTAEILRLAGANVSAVSSAEAYTNDFIAQAENTINVLTRFNWSDAYAGLDADVRSMLKSAGAALAAMMVINYDSSGMTARESETRLDFLRDQFDRTVKVLEDRKAQDFANNV